MIDTIVVLLCKPNFTIDNPEKFTPCARWALTDHRMHRGFQSKQNPLKKDLKAGIYKPRLTLFNHYTHRDTVSLTLKIELSLPKLMFGNNFTELRLKDCKEVLEKLVIVLSTMGISCTTIALATAPVSAIHYSKNILLTDGSTPYHFIQKIKEANIKLSLDVNQTDYRNEGHSYKWHCNTYEVAFYDKIKDLEKARLSSKRAIEKDSDLQLPLFDVFNKRKQLEILRMEVRLNKRPKIKQLLNKLGIKTDLTLKNLFKPAIAKKVLLHYIDELERKRMPLLDYAPTNSRALLAELLINNPSLSPNKILQLFGLKQALEIMNQRELRTMFARYDKRSWYRLIADVQKVQLPAASNPFKVIREQLVKFKAVKMS